MGKVTKLLILDAVAIVDIGHRRNASLDYVVPPDIGHRSSERTSTEPETGLQDREADVGGPVAGTREAVGVEGILPDSPESEKTLLPDIGHLRDDIGHLRSTLVLHEPHSVSRITIRKDSAGNIFLDLEE